MLERLIQPLSLAVAYYILGFVQVQRGDVVAAKVDLDRSIELCRAWDIRSWLTNISSITGFTYVLLGRVSEGIRLMQEGIDRALALDAMVHLSSDVGRLGEAYAIAGGWGAMPSFRRTARLNSRDGSKNAGMKRTPCASEPTVSRRSPRPGLGSCATCFQTGASCRL